jgi:hypothetical protein
VSICIFLGPSLSITQAQSVLADAVYLPPVQQGDVYQAVLQHRPHALGIIDGYFQQVPSVWHKEILWAMQQGIHVFGSASMGALRAAELAAFGMQGVGKVFAAYRDGVFAPYHDDVFEDDDEVAVVHGPAETGYIAISEALVNIRATLAAAAAAEVITAAERNALAALTKQLFYPRRSYQKLLQLAAEQTLTADRLQALAAWLPAGQINLKRDDALAMLTAIGELDGQTKQVDYHFAHTTMWENLANSLNKRTFAYAAADERHWQTAVLDELRLQGYEAYQHIRHAALLRWLLLEGGNRPQTDVNEEHQRRTLDRFRRQNKLLNRAALQRWMSDNDLSPEAFSELLRDSSQQLQYEQVIDDALLQPHMIACLQIQQMYPPLAGRARHKFEILPNREAEPLLDDYTCFKLLNWYFGNRRQRSKPEDVDTYASELGYKQSAEFYRVLLGEYMYCNKTEQNTAEDDHDGSQN